MLSRKFKFSRFILIMILLFMVGCVSTTKPIQPQRQTLDSQLENLVTQIVQSLSENDKTKIAIIEFSDIQGNVSNLGRYMAEELTTRLFRTNKFEVVERQLMNKLLQEQNLGVSGFIDDDTAVSLGQILGVDAIASGSITDLGMSVKVNARLISAETGKVFAVASVKIPKDNTVSVLMQQTTKPLSKKKSPASTNYIIQKEGFEFELIEARMADRIVTCQIKITNTTEDDKDFQVTYGWQYQTMIFDESGNQYIISAVKYANQMQKIDGLSQYSCAAKKIVAESSVNMELYFEKVSSKATDISLLQILCGYRGFKIEFRNIPIIKS